MGGVCARCPAASGWMGKLNACPWADLWGSASRCSMGCLVSADMRTACSTPGNAGTAAQRSEGGTKASIHLS